MLFLWIHLLITAIVVLIFTRKSNKQEFIYNFLIALFFPIGGYVLVVLFRKNRDIPLKQVEDDEIEKKVLLFTDHVDGRLNNNVISLEETFLVNSNKEKRKRLLDYLKKENIYNISILKTALKDSDIETSHYASAAILEEKRKIELSIQQFNSYYEINKNDMEILKGYGNMLKNYLNSGLLDGHGRRRYSHIYLNILKEKINLKKSQEDYEEIIDLLIDINMMVECGMYCEEFIREFKCEEAYIKNLKFFYTEGDKKNFNRTFKDLINSDISFSPSCLDFVRYWMGKTNEV